jgi:ribokinase
VTGRVVVVGSVNVDLVVRAASLPVPGETVTGGTFEQHQGGKGGNQAVAAARLGRPTLFIGAVGDDEFGRDARAALAAEVVDVSALETVADTPTGVALILVDAQGENLISVASGANSRLSADSVRRGIARLGPLSGDVVLVSREIPSTTVVAALRLGREAGARTILNTAPATGLDPAELSLADIVIPNRGELEACAMALPGGRVPSADVDRARRLIEHGITEAVVVTLGADGALVVEAGSAEVVHVPALAAEVVDTTGAGDAFAGALAASLAEARPLGEAVRRAVAAAGLSTTKAGAREGMPTRAELEAAIAPGDRGGRPSGR